MMMRNQALPFFPSEMEHHISCQKSWKISTHYETKEHFKMIGEIYIYLTSWSSYDTHKLSLDGAVLKICNSASVLTFCGVLFRVEFSSLCKEDPICKKSFNINWLLMRKNIWQEEVHKFSRKVTKSWWTFTTRKDTR